jgi:hypothetical protein
MKTEKQIRKLIQTLEVELRRGTPCGKRHGWSYRNKEGELITAYIFCTNEKLCGNCKRLRNTRSQNTMIKTLKQVLQ